MNWSVVVASLLCLISWVGAFVLLGHGISTGNHDYSALAIFVAVFAGGCLYGAISEFLLANKRNEGNQDQEEAA